MPTTRRQRRARKQPELFVAVPAKVCSRDREKKKKSSSNSSTSRQQRRAHTEPKTQGGKAKRGATGRTSNATVRRRGSGKVPSGDTVGRKKQSDDEHEGAKQNNDEESSTGSADTCSGQSVHSLGEKSFRSNTKANRTSPQASEMSRCSVSLPIPDAFDNAAALAGRRRHHHPGSTEQFLGEDIICDTGLAFIAPLYDSDRDETYEQWQSKYQHGPGVTRVQTMTSRAPRKYNRRGSSSSVGSSGAAAAAAGRNGSADVRYKSYTTYKGIRIGLGTHHSSAAALAMQDLANLALLGSEHSKTMQLLSRDEAWAALHAAKLPGVQPYGQVEQFQSLFTEKFKPIFEEKLEDALTSIGGQDDALAEALCCLDMDTQRQAEADDALQEAELAKARKRHEKELARRARRAEKLARKYARKSRGSRKVNIPRYRGKHGIYGIDDHGKYFWFRARDHSKIRRRKSIQAGTETGKDTTPDQTERPICSQKRDENVIAEEYAPQPETTSAMAAENVEADASQYDSTPFSDSSSASSTSSSSSSMSYASSISSAGLSEMRNDRVRILPFDDSSNDEDEEGISTARIDVANGPRRGVPGAASSSHHAGLEARGNDSETRAPGIPAAITITSPYRCPPDGSTTFESHSPELNEQNEEEVDTSMQPPSCIAGSFEPLLQIFGGASKQSDTKEESSRDDLQAALRIFNEFEVTPLLSYSQNGARIADSDSTGKTLTGIKFRRKNPLNTSPPTNQDNEFIINVCVDHDNIPVLSLRG